MAKIQLTKNEQRYIAKMGGRMQEQNNRLTSFVMFVVYDKEEVVTADGYGDKTVLVETHTGDYCEFENAEAAKEWIKEHFGVYEGGDIAPKDFDVEAKYEEIIEEKAIKEVDRYQQIFFTVEAAEAWMQTNDHHLHKPFVYGVSAYGNYELQTVQRLLMNGLEDHKNGVYSK